jgi:DNA polymerase III subunit chi
MTAIDFYFNADDRLQVACRLAAKAASQNTRMLIYAPDGDTASRVDRLLWTWQALAFVPHCAPHDAVAGETPILIATGEETPEAIGVLLNLSAGTPPHFERFERMLELVGRDDEEKKAGRGRYRYYRDRGYKITDHDLAHE